MEVTKCEECGTEVEKYSDCPITCPTCNVQICPDCKRKLTGKHVEYCGFDCEYCGWHHCGGCQ